MGQLDESQDRQQDRRRTRNQIWEKTKFKILSNQLFLLNEV